MLKNERPTVSEYGATLQCAWCAIFIGEGHADQAPLRAPDGKTPLCRACYQAALRRVHRQAD